MIQVSTILDEIDYKTYGEKPKAIPKAASWTAKSEDRDYSLMIWLVNGAL